MIFKNYFKSHNQTIYENPSPGNKKGGISTLEDKSLGCTQKSGSAAVKGVLSYGEPVSVKGLNLLSDPGQRSGRFHGAGSLRRAHRPIHDRPRNSVCLPGPDDEDFFQHSAV